jgi:hypothetical protein
VVLIIYGGDGRFVFRKRSEGEHEAAKEYFAPPIFGWIRWKQFGASVSSVAIAKVGLGSNTDVSKKNDRDVDF